ncbi:MAG: type 1 pili tip component [Steroidobacteraceae bacterium]
MSFKDLLESWRETTTQPRTATEYAVRLPVDAAARLAALAEMFPGRSPEQLITDLLAAALQEVETSMPYIAGKKVISSDEQGDPIYEDIGPTPRFVELTRKNRKKLQTEFSKAK